MPEQIGGEHRDIGQVLLGQRLPPLAVPGQSVDEQQLGRLVGAVPVDVQLLG